MMNPLTAERLAKVHYVFPNTLNDWSVILTHLKQVNYQAAIVGGPGTGKSTLLRDLEPTLAVSTRSPVSRVAVDPTTGMIPSVECDAETFVLIDDADRIGFLGRPRFNRLLKECRGVIVTSRGQTDLPIIARCEVTPLLLHQILSHVCETPPFRAVEEILLKHHGNAAEAIREIGLRYHDLMRELEG